MKKELDFVRNKKAQRRNLYNKINIKRETKKNNRTRETKKNNLARETKKNHPTRRTTRKWNNASLK